MENHPGWNRKRNSYHPHYCAVYTYLGRDIPQGGQGKYYSDCWVSLWPTVLLTNVANVNYPIPREHYSLDFYDLTLSPNYYFLTFSQRCLIFKDYSTDIKEDCWTKHIHSSKTSVVAKDHHEFQLTLPRAGNPSWSGSLTTVGLLLRTSLYQLVLILQTFFLLFTKQATIPRRSIVLSLPLSKCSLPKAISNLVKFITKIQTLIMVSATMTALPVSAEAMLHAVESFGGT